MIFGLTTQFLPGKVGLVINLLCLFMNGAGVRTNEHFYLSLPEKSLGMLIWEMTDRYCVSAVCNLFCRRPPDAEF